MYSLLLLLPALLPPCAALQEPAGAERPLGAMARDFIGHGRMPKTLCDVRALIEHAVGFGHVALPYEALVASQQRLAP